MSLVDITTALQQIFIDEVSTPLGIEFRIQNDLRDNPTATPWAYLEVLELSFERQALGVTVNVYEETGVFSIQLFSDLGKGTKDIQTIAEQIRDVYNDRDLAPSSDVQLRLEYPNVTIVGKVADYFQVNVSCDWTANVQNNK